MPSHADSLQRHVPASLLSPQDVAEIFNRSKRTIRRWVEQKRLTPVRIGGSVFYRRTDLDRILGPFIEPADAEEAMQAIEDEIGKSPRFQSVR